MASSKTPDFAPVNTLLPIYLDECADVEPGRLYARIPKTDKPKDGYTDITVGDFARAIDRVAWWLEELLGKSTTFETVAYIGPSDLRYFIMMLAGHKLGYKIFTPSPRNSLVAQVNLFDKTSCKILISAANVNVEQYLDGRDMRHFTIAELEELLNPKEVPRYKFSKTYEEAKDDPSLVLHTSGSTGMPKPIYLTHSWIGGFIRTPQLDLYEGYEPAILVIQGKNAISALPPFHSAGTIGGLAASILWKTIHHWPPANRPVSAIMIDEMLEAVQPDLLFAPPSILEDLSASTESLERISKVSSLIYGGGPLSRHAGEILTSRTSLRTIIGSTEATNLPFYNTAAENWEYFHANPSLKGLEFRPNGEDTFELFLIRHPSTDPYHILWQTFPELQEYSTNDLFSKHPTAPNHWLYVGRADDVIVLSNGEKFNPISSEATLREHPDVQGALIVGQGKFSSAAFLELTPDGYEKIKTPEDRTRFVESVWPYAVEANKSAPAHAQLAIDRITIAPAEKPFLRAGKGTVQRVGTVRSFDTEIEALYSRLDEDSTTHFPPLDLNQDLALLQKDLRNAVQQVIGIELATADQDFFSAGVDSLHVMKLSRYLKSALTRDASHADKISTRFIYSNPTLDALASSLKQLSDNNESAVPEKAPDDRVKTIEATLQKYIDDLPEATSKATPKQSNQEQRHTIILTGSTGSLGSYLLDALVASPQVQKVYCLNRKEDAGQIQAKTNASRGLISEWGTKVTFLRANLSKPQLDLSEANYDKLFKEATLIIRVANFIKLSAASSLSPPIFFTSSIGTVGAWSYYHPNEKVPETALTDPNYNNPQGYSESKWVAERLLASAAKKSAVSSAVCRVGQIAGPVGKGEKGQWNTQEWLPSIIASSKYLGAIPDSLGAMNTVHWTPVNLLSDMLVELALRPNDDNGTWTRYYHLDNPHSTAWSSLVLIVQEHFSSAEDLKSVSLNDWVQKLAASGQGDEADATKNPGLKLVDFYEGLGKAGGGAAVLATTETSRGSETMRNVKAVDAEWMRLWLKQWAF